MTGLILYTAGLFVSLVAYACALDLRKRLAESVVAIPVPVPVNPCQYYHAITPIASIIIDQPGEAVRTSAIYRCERCTSVISAIYPGRFTLDELAKTESPKQSFEKMVGM